MAKKKFLTKKRRKELARVLKVLGWILVISSLVGVALVGLGVI